jgi:tripartite-type tricarboxylate transporter receptor subunit TctC
VYRHRKDLEERMKLTTLGAALAISLACVAGAHGQAYPSRPVTIIVPFPAGGPTDTLARILSERMRTALGQTVIVENVTGAGASIGVARAGQAASDGYTLSLGNWTSHVGAGAMYPAAHEAILEMEPVARISATPLMIVGKNALPPKDAKELIGWLKANPGKAVGRNHRRRQRRARLPAVLSAEDRHQLRARALPRRRAGDAGSRRGTDRHVLRRGVADAVVRARRQD